MNTSELLTSKRVSSAMVKRLERTEAAYWMRYYGQNVPMAYVNQVARAMACSMPELDVLAYNRVIGLGLDNPIEPGHLEELIRFYKWAGASRFFVQLPPQLVDELTACTLEQHGFVHHNHWSKLWRGTEPLTKATNQELRVKRLTKANATIFGELIYENFDWQYEGLPTQLSSTVGQRGYTHYLVLYRDQVIAVGALYVEGDMAAMAFAATRKQFRGLGAQSLLLKTRIEEAGKQGAKWICSETARHTEERPVKSYENMLKAGFELAYQRQNWLYTF